MTELSFYTPDHLPDEQHQAKILLFKGAQDTELKKDFRVCADSKPRYTTGRDEEYIPAGTTKAHLDKIFGAQVKNESAQTNNIFAFNVNHIKSPACY